MSDVLDVLQKARDLLVVVGLNQSGYYWPGTYLTSYRNGDPVCTLGAIYAATSTPVNEPTPVAVSKAFDALYEAHEWRESLAAWNDRPSRTLADVLALYDAAIHAWTPE